MSDQHHNDERHRDDHDHDPFVEAFFDLLRSTHRELELDHRAPRRKRLSRTCLVWGRRPEPPHIN